MNLDQAVKLIRSHAGMNAVDARKLAMALSALDVLKLDDKPQPNGVWAVDDQVSAQAAVFVPLADWHGC